VRLSTALAIVLATAVSAQNGTVEYYGVDALGSVRVVRVRVRCLLAAGGSLASVLVATA
jgi:hypothetical protein